jgi:hypothetical protein
MKRWLIKYLGLETLPKTIHSLEDRIIDLEIIATRVELNKSDAQMESLKNIESILADSREILDEGLN